MVGLTTPTAGELRVFGLPALGPGAAEARRLVGYAPQDIALDRFVPVRELLALHGRYFGMPRAEARTRADEMLEVFDLTAKAGELPAHPVRAGCAGASCWLGPWSTARGWSSWTSRRPASTSSCATTSGPTSGALHADGTTILLTTHYLEEAEELCERVAFIRAGRIVAEGPPEDLRERFGAASLEGVYLHLVGR